MVGGSALLFVNNALFSLVTFLFIATACCRSLILEIVLVSLLVLREEVLTQTFLCLLRWEDSFKLPDGFSNFRLVRCIVQKSSAEVASGLLEDRAREVAVLVAATRGPAEGRLKREAIYQIELTPHDDSRSGFSRLLNDEVAAVEAEILRVLREKKRVDALFQTVCFLVGAAVHEKILCSGVTVIVTVEQDITRVLRLSHHDLGCKVLRTLLHGGSLPLPIQIEPGQRGSIVAHDDAIGIEHWNDFENEVVA